MGDVFLGMSAKSLTRPGLVNINFGELLAVMSHMDMTSHVLGTCTVVHGLVQPGMPQFYRSHIAHNILWGFEWASWELFKKSNSLWGSWIGS